MLLERWFRAETEWPLTHLHRKCLFSFIIIDTCRFQKCHLFLFYLRSTCDYARARWAGCEHSTRPLYIGGRLCAAPKGLHCHMLLSGRKEDGQNAKVCRAFWLERECFARMWFPGWVLSASKHSGRRAAIISPVPGIQCLLPPLITAPSVCPLPSPTHTLSCDTNKLPDVSLYRYMLQKPFLHVTATMTVW